MLKLTDQCFTVQNGKVVAHVVSDFSEFIETTSRPTGIGHKYYATTVERVTAQAEVDEFGNVTKEPVVQDVWVMAMWATWGGPERVLQEYESEGEANEAVEQSQIYDILNNNEVVIHIKRASAEAEASDWRAENDQ